jgi:hypothetical protein
MVPTPITVLVRGSTVRVPEQGRSLDSALQAQVYATKTCVVESPDKDCRNRNIYILSNSKALDKYRINSKLVWDWLVKLAKRNRVMDAELREY